MAMITEEYATDLETPANQSRREWKGVDDDRLTLSRGGSLTAEEVERVVGQDFSELRFAALCNEIALATTRRLPGAFPELAERVVVQEGGIDPDWEVEVFADRVYGLPLLRPGRNAFECRREAPAEDPDRAFSSLAARVHGAIRGIAHRSGTWPDRYVLFTNLCLSWSSDVYRLKLQRSVRLGSDWSHEVDLEILGAEEIAGYLNRLPYLRAAFFEDSGFQVGREAWRNHARPQVFGVHADLAGREDELSRLRWLLADPDVRVIALTGGHGMGKTRLALEAASNSRDSIMVPDARAATPERLSRLITRDKEIVAIVEDCDPVQAEQLIRAFRAGRGLKLLLTIAPGASARVTGCALDNPSAVRNIYLSPMPDSAIRNLLNSVVTGLDAETESRIVQESDGNPGILLAAAGFGQRLRSGASGLPGALQQDMKDKINREFGDSGYRILSLLSLMNRISTGRPRLTSRDEGFESARTAQSVGFSAMPRQLATIPQQ